MRARGLNPMSFIRSLLTSLLAIVFSFTAFQAAAQDDTPAGPILFTNVNIFDGVESLGSE